MLRVSVNGGGCSGFQYEFGFDRSRNADDLVVERDGATVLVDAVSLPFVAGSTLDFVDDLMGQSFRVEQSQRDRLLRLRHQLLDLTSARTAERTGHESAG